MLPDSPRPLIPSIVVALALMLSQHTSVSMAKQNASVARQGTELTGEQKERLKQRDHWGEQTAKLRQDGKLVEAIEAANKMLAIEREVFGNAHENVVGSLEHLAEMHEERDEFDVARQARQEVLAIRTSLHLPDDRDYWQVTNARLALEHLYFFATLDTEARRTLLDAKALDKQVEQQYSQGKYQEAIPLTEQALAIRKKVLGEEHPDTALSLINLGSLLERMGDYAAARGYHEQALAICKKVLAEEHRNTATILNNLGSLLHSMRDYAAARRYLEQALAMLKKVLGEEHPDTAANLNDLGLLLASMGDYAAARGYHEQALAICKKVLGEEHPDTATCLNNLGMLLKRMGDYAAARGYFEQVVAVRVHLAAVLVPSLSEAEALAHLENMHSGRDPLLSVLRRLPGATPEEAGIRGA